METTEQLAAQFLGPSAETFPTSPLYRSLRATVVDLPDALEILRHRRPGQQAPYLFFGAVHYLLLSDAQHELREFFPSLVGGAARPPATAGPVLADFCRRYEEGLERVIRTRLVQTNAVRRAVGLRYVLALLASQVSEPIHLIEVGASAGCLLHVDRYRYRIGGRSFGDPAATVTIDSRWLGVGPIPELGPTPAIASRVGIDLNPVDVTDPDQRRWLRALVWPENTADAQLLEAALDDLASDPPHVIRGDAVDVCRELASQLPTGQPRLVFHAATRMHVSPDRQADFDAAIDALDVTGPLFHAWMEPTTAPHGGAAPDDQAALRWHTPDRPQPRPVIQIAGHGEWLASVDFEGPEAR